jgi:hypothetical protein
MPGSACFRSAFQNAILVETRFFKLDDGVLSMAVPPEVAFSRFFQERFPYVPPVRPEDPDPRLFRGRHDLSGLPHVLQEQLRSIQESFNEALWNEKQNVPEHVDHPPFHVDYVDSGIQNAIAFRYGDYSFIAITVPLIYAMSDVCLLLSKSPTVATLLGARPSDEEYNELHAVLFYTLSAFVVAHEWAHHVHGHVCLPGEESIFPNEILDTGYNGSIDEQIKELVADGYSAYHVLANLIDSPTRPWILTLLKLDADQANVQDEVLFSLFVVAVGAYLFVRPAPDFNEFNIYKLTHPPQAMRMNLIVREAILGWCRRFRPELEVSMTKSRVRNLMNAAIEATLRKSGTQVWGDQAAFLRSKEGAKYTSALDQGIDDYKQSLLRAVRDSTT